MRKTVKMSLPFMIMIISLTYGSAIAQPGFGLRAGVTADPDQFHFGAHYVSDPLLGHLAFRPNLEIGIGSDTTAIAANFEFAYNIPISKRDFSVYIGAGPALNVFRRDRPEDDRTDTGGGFNVLLGMEHKKGLFGEFKVGALDSPEVKFTVGYTFR